VGVCSSQELVNLAREMKRIEQRLGRKPAKRAARLREEIMRKARLWLCPS
jgi:hypothetical protein